MPHNMGQKAFLTSVSKEDLFEFLQKYGHNTHSFLLAYGECDWFRCDTPPGLVACVLRGHTCVVVGDPLCEPEHAAAVLDALSQRIGKRYRIMLTLASAWLVTQLRQIGYGAVEIGRDPFFDLGSWKPRGNRTKKIRSAVNLARRTGVTVSAYYPSQKRDLHLEREMLSCAKAWLESQRGFTIRVLSEVRPLESAGERRYFIARHKGRLVGLLTCSPIYARNGWFIEDVLRLPQAPYGTSESLIGTALESLREEGFDIATLGPAPFVDLETDTEHPGRTRLLRAILTVLRPFYNFRGVAHFRRKFAPTWWEPVYLAFWPDRITAGLAFDVINALFPEGFQGLARSWLVSRIRAALAQPLAVLQRGFLFLHLDLYVPLKRRYRLLDSFAIGVGLAVALVVLLATYQEFRGPDTVTVAVSEFCEKWGRGPVLAAIYVFLAWRLLAMLSRAWQAGKDDSPLTTTDRLTKE